MARYRIWEMEGDEIARMTDGIIRETCDWEIAVLAVKWVDMNSYGLILGDNGAYVF